ncbi:MAG: hypothetical protein K0Q57_356 [Gammaproteobacteria bacterium]|jgi:hypothetical protein|nr:hypothetical protein [Gammaproteobacteria bacterium]
MRLKSLSFVLLGCLLASSANADTQNMNVPVSITVIAPVGININNNINFGKFAPGTTTSTIEVASDGTRSVTSGDADLASGVTPTALSFTVTGAAGYAVTLSYDPSSGNTINLTGPGSSLALSLISSSSSCTLDGTGQCSITVGSSISVPTGQLDGSYNGTVTIYAQYT